MCYLYIIKLIIKNLCVGMGLQGVSRLADQAVRGAVIAWPQIQVAALSRSRLLRGSPPGAAGRAGFGPLPPFIPSAPEKPLHLLRRYRPRGCWAAACHLQGAQPLHTLLPAADRRAGKVASVPVAV